MEGHPILDSTELANRIVQTLVDRKAANVVMLDLRPVSILADYFIICNGENERHVQALLRELLEKLGEQGVDPLWVEGTGDSGWVILDYGSVVVHVFTPAMRDYYQLEKVWSDARPVVVIQ